MFKAIVFNTEYVNCKWIPYHKDGKDLLYAKFVCDKQITMYDMQGTPPMHHFYGTQFVEHQNEIETDLAKGKDALKIVSLRRLDVNDLFVYPILTDKYILPVPENFCGYEATYLKMHLNFIKELLLDCPEFFD